jgi:MFS family permease
MLRVIKLDRLLWVSIFIMMTGLGLMGVAANYEFYLLGAAVYGFSLGATGVSQNLLIAENTTAEIQTKALSALHGFYGLSSLIAPFLASRAPAWFTNNYPNATYLADWQSAFFITCFFALVVLMLMLTAKPQTEFATAEATEISEALISNSNTLRFWFAGFFATYVAAEILVSTRLALYVRTYYEMDFIQSSNYVTYFFCFLLLGRLIFTVKNFNMKIKTQLNFSLLLSSVFLTLGLLVHPLFLTLVGLAMAPFYPLAIVYISEKTGVNKRSYLTFVMGAQSLCVIVMQIGAGKMTDVFGLSYAFGLGILLLIGSFLCLNMHPKT